MKHLWKSMHRGMKSCHGKIDWKTGEWQTVKGSLQMCKNGFHASESIIDAIKYVDCEMLACVEVSGQSIIQSDKQVWEKMRIIESWTWKKRDSVKLAIFAAELVIDNFEKKYPNDNRPGNAIKAAKQYRAAASRSAAVDAAWATWAATWAAARAAETARAAAVDAAWAATEAARAASGDAAWASGDAAWAAESAGWAATWAARAAAGAAIWASGAAARAAARAAESAGWAAAWAASGAARAAAGAASGNTGAAAGEAGRAALIKKCDQLVISILKEKRNNEK